MHTPRHPASSSHTLRAPGRRFHAWHRPALAALLACAAALPALPATAATLARIDSPGQVLSVTLESQHEDRLAYRIEHKGTPVIAPSRLGFVLGDGRLERNLELLDHSSHSVDQTWEQPWGERRLTRNHYNELRARFAEKPVDARQPGRRIDVVFRVYDDGVGFRYEFPEPAGTEVRIRQELTEFALADVAHTTAWWIPAFEWNRAEYLYSRTPLQQVGTAQTPLTLRTGDGLHVAIHEAALVDYAGMNLARGDGDVLRAALTPGNDHSAPVVRTAPFATPWRTVQIGQRAGDLVQSSLILNLNAPNVLGDVSWFTPAKYVGVWWSLHLETETWATGPKHGATTANTRRYIDFAAANGFRGVLVEGWNPGWDGNWFANGQGFDFTRPTADFDLEGLARYAAGKGVHLIGHHETACAVSHYERQLPAALDLYARHGVDVVKTGYVCDAGDIQRQDSADGPVLREWHEGQWMSNHHLRVLEAAAQRHIAVNSHEPIKDTGLRRTYPNWVSREGARGMEFAAWADPPNPPGHEATLVFTRMLAGPMDFHPRHRQPAWPQRPTTAQHPGQATGAVRGPVQPGPDGGRPAGALRPTPGRIPVHQGRGRGLGTERGGGWAGRRIRDHRPQGPGRRHVVPGQRRRRPAAQPAHPPVLPRRRTPLPRRDLPRRCGCGLGDQSVRLCP